MATLSVPFSASQHRAQAKVSSKYAASEASTANESEDGAALVSTQSTRNQHDPPVKASGGGKRRDQKRQSMPVLEAIPSQKPSPLRRRSSPSPLASVPKPAPAVVKSLTKNYAHMVKDFKLMQKYAKQANGTFLATTLCVFCELVVPQLVFFPCQHRCVCDRCLVVNDITCEPTSATSWTACPICMADIKLMLAHTGDEESVYWKWALEYPPTLPDNFREDFRDAGKRLRRGSSSVQPETVLHDPVKSSKVPASPPLTAAGAPPDRAIKARRSVTGSQHSTRRFSLVHRRYSTAGGGAASTTDAQPKCTIL